MCEMLVAKRTHSVPDDDENQTKHRRDDDSLYTSEMPSEGSGQALELFPDSSWLYQDCVYCNSHMLAILNGRLHGEKTVLQMHAQYSVFSRSSRGNSAGKEGVRAFKDELLQKVCGLRNERGGVLVVHVTEKPSERGPSLDDFDQKVGDELSRMVEDDTLYVENYDRRWCARTAGSWAEGTSTSSQVVDYLDYIIINVKGSSSVSTKDFNTLVTWDGSKERPKAREISRLLWRTDLQFCGPIRETGVSFTEGERIDLYESRDIQLKRLYDMDLEKDLYDNPSLVGQSVAYRIVYRLKEKLHLLEYITSFTKLRTGGSFYCGIEEEKLKASVTGAVSELQSRSSKKRKRKKKSHQKEDGKVEDDGVDSHADPNMAGGKLKEMPVFSSSLEKELCLGNQKELCPISGSQSDTTDTSTHLVFATNTPYSSARYLPSILPTNSTPHDKGTPAVASKNGSGGTTSGLSSPTGNGRSFSGGMQHHRAPSSDAAPGPAGLLVLTDAAAHADCKDYKTAHNIVRGFKLSPADLVDLQKELVRTVQTDMLWLRTDGSRLSVEDVAKEICVRFHRTSESRDTFVIEVRVMNVFPGIVFYKSYGPDAFRLTGVAERKPRVVRMDPGEWIWLLKKAMQCDNCDKPIWKLREDDEDDFSFTSRPLADL